MGRVDLIGEHPFADECLNRVWQMRGSYAGTALDILMWEARVREILDDGANLRPRGLRKPRRAQAV